MHHSYTCANHPTLRWSSKDIATRHLFFKGKAIEPLRFYPDGSGVVCTPASECDCPITDLILAPEDNQIQHWLKKSQQRRA